MVKDSEVTSAKSKNTQHPANNYLRWKKKQMNVYENNYASESLLDQTIVDASR